MNDTTNFIGRRLILVRSEYKKDAYVDQFGIKHYGYVCSDPYAVEVVHQHLDWAVPDYHGKPYEPYGKVWHLIAHGGGREFTCTQNWDGGGISLWVRDDDAVFQTYGDSRSGTAPAVTEDGESFSVPAPLLQWVAREGQDAYPIETEVTINGITYQRNVTRRCPNITKHKEGAVCVCPPNVPEPCTECYAIESLTRKVPWAWAGRMRQEGAEG